MNLPLPHRTVSIVILTGLMFINGASGQRKLANRDKSQIIQFILRTYDFTQSETWRDNGENTILLLDENISPADIPARKGVKFTLIKPGELDRSRNTGIEYYEFRPFEITRSGVRTSFIRTYRSAKEVNGSAMEYTCRKIGGR